MRPGADAVPIAISPPEGIRPAEIGSDGDIVIRVPNWIGDAVLCIPALRALADHFQERSVIVVARGVVAPLFVGQRGVSEVVQVGGRGAGRLADARQALRTRNLALGVVFPHSLGAAAELAAGGVPRLWGFGGLLRGLAVDVQLPRRWLRGRHRWEAFALLAAAVTGRAVPEVYDLVIGSGDVAAADRLFEEIDGNGQPRRPIVGLVPGAHARSRRWPGDRFVEIASRLGRDDVQVVVFGSRAERKLTESIVERARPRPVDWAGRTPLPVLAECFRRLDYLITNDTGPMHLAAAVDTPLLDLCGAANEVVTGPRGRRSEIIVHPVWCRPCVKNTCAYNLECMRGIGVDEVVRRVEARLG